MNPPSKESLGSSLSAFIKRWGFIGVTTHVFITLFSFLCWYQAVSSGVDVQKLMDKLYKTTGWKLFKLDAASTGSKLAAAYIIHKATSPLRWPLTFIFTPLVSRALGIGPKDEEPEK
ncbi:hypothetical protein AKO1_001071 [Acrasis kona]|uniref:DUF1279 domain-containing protein n=1 Tax=Acrasis kona TaxID=1008807 RepID=A0AAW2YRB2_9EUKA